MLYTNNWPLKKKRTTLNTFRTKASEKHKYDGANNFPAQQNINRILTTMQTPITSIFYAAFYHIAGGLPARGQKISSFPKNRWD